MNDKFWDLRKEKQDRIINAAMKIFTECGYKRASTDEIVKEAGISKGLLFHYFISKQGLYLFLYEYSIQFLEMEYVREVDEKETDLFEIQKQIEYAKRQVMKHYPYMYLFLNSAFLEENPEIQNQTADKREHYASLISGIYARADLSMLKQGLNPAHIMKMMIFTVDGLRREQMEAGRADADALYKEAVAMLTIMKENFCVSSEEISG